MNIREIIRKQSSEHLAYIAIAVVGFISSVVALFVDVNSEISIKWLLFATTLFLIITIFLIRLSFAIASTNGLGSKIRIIKVYKDKGIIAVRSPTELAINSLLSLYEKIDSYEELIGMGYVQNKQEDGILSIKIVYLNENGISDDFRKNGLIKTTLPYDLMAALENENG